MSDDTSDSTRGQLSLSDSITRLSSMIPHKPGQRATRTEVYRRLGNRRPNIDLVLDAMVEQELIDVELVGRGRKRTEWWVWTGGDDDIVPPPRYESHAECSHACTAAARIRCRRQRGA